MEIPEIDVAIQFLMTVSSIDTVGRRPKTVSIDEIHRFTLQNQIQDTAKVGRDSGKVVSTSKVTYSLIPSFHRSFTVIVHGRSVKSPYSAALLPEK